MVLSTWPSVSGASRAERELRSMQDSPRKQTQGILSNGTMVAASYLDLVDLALQEDHAIIFQDDLMVAVFSFYTS